MLPDLAGRQLAAAPGPVAVAMEPVAGDALERMEALPLLVRLLF